MAYFKDLTWTLQSNSGSGDLAVDMPASVAAGDVLIACVHFGYVPAPDGWNFKGGTWGTAGWGMAMYERLADGSEGGTTVNFPRRASSASKPATHCVWHGGGFTYVDAGGSGAEDRTSGSEYAAMSDGGYFTMGTDTLWVFAATCNGATNPNTSNGMGGTCGGGAPAPTVRGFQEIGPYSGMYQNLIIGDVWLPAGVYDPGAATPPDADAEPWAVLNTVSAADYLLWGNVVLNGPVPSGGPAAGMDLRLRKVRVGELPYQLHTRM